MSTVPIEKQTIIETDEQADKLINALKKSMEIQDKNEQEGKPVKHKYLYELYEKNKKSYPFAPEKPPYPFTEEDYPDEEYSCGFDQRETYEFSMFMIAWLYERLRYFQDVVSKNIDMTFHKFDINGEELTQKQCVDMMVEDCKTILLADELRDKQYEEKIDAAKNDLFMILSKVFWAMWW